MCGRSGGRRTRRLARTALALRGRLEMSSARGAQTMLEQAISHSVLRESVRAERVDTRPWHALFGVELAPRQAVKIVEFLVARSEVDDHHETLLDGKPR